MDQDFAKILYHYDEILLRIKHLAESINTYYKHAKNVLVVPILDGAIVFAGHLIPLLDFDLTVRCTKISSYFNTKKSNEDPKVHISIDMSLVKNKRILIIEDLIDRGHTLKLFSDYLFQMGALEIKIVVLFNKQIASIDQRQIMPDWNGFLIPDEWVAGFGIDSESKYRNFPHFGIVKKT